jgi:peptidoglycan/LPS O-acetylase OafA/YrhL
MISQRNGLLDVLRFVAALGIVFFHLKVPGSILGLSALSFFTAVMCCFAASSTKEESFQGRLKKLSIRLCLPWLIWSAIYMLAKLTNAYVDNASYWSEFESWMWWTGPSVHLWFLPFAFTISLLIYQLLAPIQLSDRIYWGFAAAIVPLCLICFYAVELKLLNIPWVQWVSVLPAAAVGVALAAARNQTNRTIALIFAISVAFYATQRGHLQWLSLQFYVGTLLAIFGTMLKLRGTRLTAWLGNISLGVYLAHPLCAAALAHIFSLQNVWIVLVGTIVLSMILAEVYRRFEGYWRGAPKFQTVKQ